jgi:hypothetical protein
MHRFGRMGRNKLNDQWGVGFILATCLAVLAAWYVGTNLGKWFGDKTAVDGGMSGSDTAGNSAQTPDMAVTSPGSFEMKFVQVGAFRSEAQARKLARSLLGQSVIAMVKPKGADGLYRVLVGPYSSDQSVAEAKDRLAAVGGSLGITGSFVYRIAVNHNPEAIPVSAGGNHGAEVKKGVDMLNTYLHEVALWLESRAADPGASPAKVQAMAQDLANLAATLKNNQDPKVQQFADLAARAGNTGAAIESAVSGTAGDEVLTAMSEYFQLVDQYQQFQAK